MTQLSKPRQACPLCAKPIESRVAQREHLTGKPCVEPDRDHISPSSHPDQAE